MGGSRSGGARARPLSRKKRKLSTALRRMRDRAAAVTDAEVDQYRPRKTDLKIAESLLAGCVSPAEISARIGRTEDWVRRALLNPTRAAWITRQVGSHFVARIGLVDAALFRRAAEGHIPSARLMYERFRVFAPETVSQHNHVHIDMRQLSDTDLRKIIAEKLRRAGGAEAIIDTTAEEIDAPQDA